MTRQRALGKMLVGSVLRATAARHPSREALYCVKTGRRFSYLEFNQRSNKLANGLLGLGLEPGSVVAFLCSNRAEIIETYFALAKSGLVGLPLNYRLAPVEMVDLLTSMKASTLICESRFAEAHSRIADAATAIRHTVWIGHDAPADAVPYVDLLTNSPDAEPQVEVDENDVFYYNLTSGTTGLPKSYAITQYNLAALDSTVITFDLTRDDVFLNAFPAFGRVGFGWSLIATLMGARNVLMDFDAARLPDIVQQESVTFTNLVPTMAVLLANEPGFDRRKFASMRAICFVGSMLPATIRDIAVSQLCPRIYEAYGLQETGNLTVSTPDDRAVKPDSVGRPILFADVRIVDSQGVDVPPGEIGEIVGRSPNGITAYFNNAAKNAEAFRDGWFHTGDLGRFDVDGYLYICGRVKDMIISGGQNVHAAEIEAALLDLPGVVECAVFGLPHPVWGEVVATAIVHSSNALQTEQVQDHCRQRLASFKVPRAVFFQPEPLPRTPTGKVQKFLLVERYAQGS